MVVLLRLFLTCKISVKLSVEQLSGLFLLPTIKTSFPLLEQCLFLLIGFQALLVAQMVKSLPAFQRPRFNFWVRKIP